MKNELSDKQKKFMTYLLIEFKQECYVDFLASPGPILADEYKDPESILEWVIAKLSSAEKFILLCATALESIKKVFENTDAVTLEEMEEIKGFFVAALAAFDEAMEKKKKNIGNIHTTGIPQPIKNEDDGKN